MTLFKTQSKLLSLLQEWSLVVKIIIIYYRIISSILYLKSPDPIYYSYTFSVSKVKCFFTSFIPRNL